MVAELLQVNALFRLRAAPGVLGVADQYGPERLEAACGKAVLVGDATYRTIKGILAAAAETDPPPAGTGDAGAAPRRSCTAPTCSSATQRRTRSPTWSRFPPGSSVGWRTAASANAHRRLRARPGRPAAAGNSRAAGVRCRRRALGIALAATVNRLDVRDFELAGVHARPARWLLGPLHTELGPGGQPRVGAGASPRLGSVRMPPCGARQASVVSRVVADPLSVY
ncbi:MAG TPA: hypothetical protein VGJ59_09455 [Jatrophihabitantaceae bacterium]